MVMVIDKFNGHGISPASRQRILDLFAEVQPQNRGTMTQQP